MANRARFINETYEDYREALKKEEAATKLTLKPRLIWPSAVLVPSAAAEYKDKLTILKPLVKLKVRGTYRKG